MRKTIIHKSITLSTLYIPNIKPEEPRTITSIIDPKAFDPKKGKSDFNLSFATI